MTDLDFHVPEFTIALRGYDRFQVDRYIDRLQGLLEDTEERLRAVEPDAHHHEVGPRITQIFDLASAEAQDIRAGAEEESTRLLEAARAEAHAVVEANQAQWEGMLAEYEAHRERIRREVEELRGQKATVLEEVRRLHQALGAASGLGSTPLPEPADARPEVSAAQTRLLDPGRGVDADGADSPAWEGVTRDFARAEAAADGLLDAEVAGPEEVDDAEVGDFDGDDRTREFEPVEPTAELPRDLREAS